MKLPALSGEEIIKILCKSFGFEVISQKGSHIKLAKNSIKTIVPNHKEVAKGTLLEILKQVKISRDDFLKYI